MNKTGHRNLLKCNWKRFVCNLNKMLSWNAHRFVHFAFFVRRHTRAHALGRKSSKCVCVNIGRRKCARIWLIDVDHNSKKKRKTKNCFAHGTKTLLPVQCGQSLRSRIAETCSTTAVAAAAAAQQAIHLFKWCFRRPFGWANVVLRDTNCSSVLIPFNVFCMNVYQFAHCTQTEATRDIQYLCNRLTVIEKRKSLHLRPGIVGYMRYVVSGILYREWHWSIAHLALMYDELINARKHTRRDSKCLDFATIYSDVFDVRNSHMNATASELWLCPLTAHRLN